MRRPSMARATHWSGQYLSKESIVMSKFGKYGKWQYLSMATKYGNIYGKYSNFSVRQVWQYLSMASMAMSKLGKYGNI